MNDLTKTDITVAENWANYVGNRSATDKNPVSVTDNTVLTVKPSVPSWRDITTGEYSFYSPYMNGSTLKWDWFKVAYNEPNSSSLINFGRSWNNDYVLIGHSDVTFVKRGGNFHYGADAGVCNSYFAYGYAGYGDGFRPALAF